MFLRIHNDRGVERLYILRSYRVGEVVKNENVKSLGRVDKLCEELNMSRDEVLAWAQAQVDELDHSPAAVINAGFRQLEKVRYSNVRINSAFFTSRVKFLCSDSSGM